MEMCDNWIQVIKKKQIFPSNIYNRFYPRLHHHMKRTPLQLGFHPCLGARQSCAHAEGLWIMPCHFINTVTANRREVFTKLQEIRSLTRLSSHPPCNCLSFNTASFYCCSHKQNKAKGWVHPNSFLHSTYNRPALWCSLSPSFFFHHLLIMCGSHIFCHLPQASC